MRPAARLALVLLPLVSVLACGGRFDGSVPGDGGSSSSSGGSSGGGSGGSSGGGSGSSSGGQDCPPPADVQSSAACSPDGLTCPTNTTIPDCNGNPGPTITCDCQGGQWFCDAPGPGCPQPVCPAAQDITPSASCDVPQGIQCQSATPIYDCNGNVGSYAKCSCVGGSWQCNIAIPPCTPDASTGCPAPVSLMAGTPCDASGVTCPGNPAYCNGQTDYDAFQCVNGVWVDVAHTVCDVDAGGFDQ